MWKNIGIWGISLFARLVVHLVLIAAVVALAIMLSGPLGLELGSFVAAGLWIVAASLLETKIRKEQMLAKKREALAPTAPISSHTLGRFDSSKYINLQTFRKTGVAVSTPVWFASDPMPSSVPRFYVYTLPDSGKVKRIRNNPKVRIAPCNMRGDLRGAWVDATARICDADEVAKGQSLLNRKYGLMKRIGDFFSRMRGRVQTVLAIEIS